METERAIEKQSEPRVITLLRGHRTRQVCGATLVLVAGVTAYWACGGLGSPRATYLDIRGQALLVDSTAMSFGVVEEGDPASVLFRLTNCGGEPVRVVGCMAYCNCIVPDDLPFTLGPSETRGFKVSVRTEIRKAGSPSELIDQPVTLFTTSPAQAEVHLTIKGEIRGSARSEGSGS